MVNGIANAMNREMISRGDLAEFRRITSFDNTSPSFRKIVNKYIPENARKEYPDEMKSKSWSVILAGMARMFPFHHDHNIAMGIALAKSHFSESRLTRLLQSSGSAFFDSVRRVSIHLASRSQRLNWIEFAALILSTNPEKKAEIREKIAIDYYKLLEQEGSGNE
ncbi:MAG: type I-E CRISPR-associated protein Cse2/CasB [Candidatus Krumholzibacteriales bacterium]